MMDENQYIYQLRPNRLQMLIGGRTSEEEDLIAQHFDYLKALMVLGIVMLAGRTMTADKHAFGIVIFRANSEEEARGIMEKDPVVQHRVMRAELYPFRVALIGA